MKHHLKVLHVDASSGFYKLERFPLGDFFGPVDLGLHLSGKYNSLNIGSGILAGSIFPGSNRLIFTGFSPSWGTFYISSMGGAALVFDNLGINILSIRSSAATPSVLYLNRTHGEEIDVQLHPLDVNTIWKEGRQGVYNIIDQVYNRFADKFETDPRILSVGPAAAASDIGAICSVPIKKGEISIIDTWAGRGGFGSKLLREHGIAAIIYGGTYADEDFRNKNVADKWFEDRYQKRMAAKDFETTKKYRFDPDLDTGGTLGVNYTKIAGRIIAFNYKSIYMDEDTRRTMHKDYIVDHYLKQFNDETIKSKSMKTCGEPCPAVCKKYHNEFKKDYEPYQSLGPLCGIFDQRAAEKLNHHADMLGFDAISIGGTLSWLMECLDEGLISPDEIGISERPNFDSNKFSIETDSMHNAEIGVSMLNTIIQGNGILNISEGTRKFARGLAHDRDKRILDKLVYTANARTGWMVPNQYWTPGVLAPMPIMGKYYNYYGNDFSPPRELGRTCAKRMKQELVLDNTGFCRFHREWGEELIPDIIENLYGKKEDFLQNISMTASRINSRNSSIYWESERNIDIIHTFLIRKHEVEGDDSKDLLHWLDYFKKDRSEAALEFWFEMSKGIHESLREF